MSTLSILYGAAALVRFVVMDCCFHPRIMRFFCCWLRLWCKGVTCYSSRSWDIPFGTRQIPNRVSFCAPSIAYVHRSAAQVRSMLAHAHICSTTLAVVRYRSLFIVVELPPWVDTSNILVSDVVAPSPLPLTPHITPFLQFDIICTPIWNPFVPPREIAGS